MTTLQKLKLTSFILAVAMIVVAVATIVCLFAMPEPMVKYEPDEGDSSEEQSSAALGFAFVLIVGVVFFIGAFLIHILYCIAPVVLSAIQFFKNKQLAIPLLVLHTISTLMLLFSTVIAFSAQPLLKPIFPVFIAVSFVLAAASLAVDIVLLKAKDNTYTAQA